MATRLTLATRLLSQAATYADQEHPVPRANEASCLRAECFLGACVAGSASQPQRKLGHNKTGPFRPALYFVLGSLLDNSDVAASVCALLELVGNKADGCEGQEGNDNTDDSVQDRVLS